MKRHADKTWVRRLDAGNLVAYLVLDCDEGISGPLVRVMITKVVGDFVGQRRLYRKGQLRLRVLLVLLNEHFSIDYVRNPSGDYKNISLSLRD